MPHTPRSFRGGTKVHGPVRRMDPIRRRKARAPPDSIDSDPDRPPLKGMCGPGNISETRTALRLLLSLAKASAIQVHPFAAERSSFRPSTTQEELHASAP